MGLRGSQQQFGALGPRSDEEHQTSLGAPRQPKGPKWDMGAWAGVAGHFSAPRVQEKGLMLHWPSGGGSMGVQEGH